MGNITIRIKKYLDIFDNRKQTYFDICFKPCSICNSPSEAARIYKWFDNSLDFHHTEMYYCLECYEKIYQN